MSDGHGAAGGDGGSDASALADGKSLPIQPNQHGAKLNRKQLDRIGERLKQVYAHLEEEPFSPRLREALERLDWQIR